MRPQPSDSLKHHDTTAATHASFLGPSSSGGGPPHTAVSRENGPSFRSASSGVVGYAAGGATPGTYSSRKLPANTRSSSSRGDLNANFFDAVGVNSNKLLQLGTALDPYSNRKEFANQQIYRATTYLQKWLGDWKIGRFFVSGAYGRKTSMATIDVDLVIFVAPEVLTTSPGGAATPPLHSRLNTVYQLLYAIARRNLEEFPNDAQRISGDGEHRHGLTLQDVPSVTSICTDISVTDKSLDSPLKKLAIKGYRHLYEPVPADVPAEQQATTLMWLSPLAADDTCVSLHIPIAGTVINFLVAPFRGDAGTQLHAGLELIESSIRNAEVPETNVCTGAYKHDIVASSIDRLVRDLDTSMVETASAAMAKLPVAVRRFIRVCRYWVFVHNLKLASYAIDVVGVLASKHLKALQNSISERGPTVDANCSSSAASSSFDALMCFVVFLHILSDPVGLQRYCDVYNNVVHADADVVAKYHRLLAAAVDTQANNNATKASSREANQGSTAFLCDEFNPYKNLLSDVAVDDMKYISQLATRTIEMLRESISEGRMTATLNIILHLDKAHPRAQLAQVKTIPISNDGLSVAGGTPIGTDMNAMGGGAEAYAMGAAPGAVANVSLLEFFCGSKSTAASVNQSQSSSDAESSESDTHQVTGMSTAAYEADCEDGDIDEEDEELDVPKRASGAAPANKTLHRAAKTTSSATSVVQREQDLNLGQILNSDVKVDDKQGVYGVGGIVYRYKAEQQPGAQKRSRGDSSAEFGDSTTAPVTAEASPSFGVKTSTNEAHSRSAQARLDTDNVRSKRSSVASDSSSTSGCGEIVGYDHMGGIAMTGPPYSIGQRNSGAAACRAVSGRSGAEAEDKHTVVRSAGINANTIDSDLLVSGSAHNNTAEVCVDEVMMEDTSDDSYEVCGAESEDYDEEEGGDEYDADDDDEDDADASGSAASDVEASCSDEDVRDGFEEDSSACADEEGRAVVMQGTGHKAGRQRSSSVGRPQRREGLFGWTWRSLESSVWLLMSVVILIFAIPHFHSFCNTVLVPKLKQYMAVSINNDVVDGGREAAPSMATTF